jgi:hypothetical protein
MWQPLDLGIARPAELRLVARGVEDTRRRAFARRRRWSCCTRPTWSATTTWPPWPSPSGQFTGPTALRRNVSALLTGPAVVLWNVEKK